MNSGKCLACGNCHDNNVFVAREMMFGTRDAFHYVECNKCKSLQIAKPPANLSDYYPSDYYSFAESHGGKLRRYLRSQRLRYAFGCGGVFGEFLFHCYGQPERGEWIKLFKARLDDRILDVGCGSGQLLSDMHEAGFKCLAGLDPFAVKKNTTEGFSIYPCHLSEWCEEQDWVMLHHSFEHMPEPTVILEHIRRILKPGGHALIRTPVANCFAWRKYGSYWVQLDAPRHLFIPSVDGLTKLAEIAGLKLVDIQFDSTDFQFWGSDLYKREIPLVGCKKQILFNRAELSNFRQLAKALNQKHDGDSACFLLRKS